MDARVDRLAQVLVEYSTEIEPGQLVVIEGHAAAAPLVRAVYARVLAAGGFPRARVALAGAAEVLLTLGTEAQLDWLNPARVEDYERADALIVLEADTNTRALTNVDPARIARAGKARKPLQDRYLGRAAAGELRWTVTVFPTNAAAQDAEMSLVEFEDFVYGAGRLDAADPVAEWRRFGAGLGRLAERLGSTSELHVVADGTDLALGVERRAWIPCAGRENFPDGEIFTAPVETRVDGEIHFTYPASFQGRLVEDVRLRFAGGEVVEATAARGQDLLQEMLEMDAGARRAGEFAFGMNDAITEFTKNTLFDEKIGGTIHLALGNAYPESGGQNRSALHWDLVCDLRAGSEVYADGELVYRDGRFVPGVF